jgi:hypothetical protein
MVLLSPGVASGGYLRGRLTSQDDARGDERREGRPRSNGRGKQGQGRLAQHHQGQSGRAARQAEKRGHVSHNGRSLAPVTAVSRDSPRTWPKGADHPFERWAGKSTTSRTESLPSSTIARRSIPKPRPPVGGIP